MRLAALERGLQAKDDAEMSARASRRSDAERLHRISRNMQMLARFVLGPGGTSTAFHLDGGGSSLGGSPEQPASRCGTPAGGGRPGSTCSNSPLASTDPIAWLEKNRHSLGPSLEARLRELEGSLGAEFAQRMAGLESRVRRLDVETLSTVVPTFHQYQEEQEAFGADLRREVMELKTVVGCLEACVPKETRKAIQLFKRAAGAEGEPKQVTPRTLQFEGKLLTLQDEVLVRLGEAEARIASQCESVTHLVKGVQVRQDTIKAELTDVHERLDEEICGSRPGSGRATMSRRSSKASQSPGFEAPRSSSAASASAAGGGGGGPATTGGGGEVPRLDALGSRGVVTGRTPPAGWASQPQLRVVPGGGGVRRPSASSVASRDRGLLPPPPQAVSPGG